MPQHKMKVKAKVPKNLKLKKKMKGPPATPRSNKPVAPNKLKLTQSQKLKKVITRNINIVMEEEIRSVVQSSKTRAASSKGAKAKKGGKK